MADYMMTIGQLAKQTGVTIRTLRYYDKINLLKPSNYTEGGHRLYSLDDLLRLQQIQSLIFIGFSLKDIAELLESDFIGKEQLNNSMTFKQRELIAEQDKISQILDQINRMKTIISDHEKIDVKLFCFVIYSILFEEENIKAYSQIEDSVHNFRSEKRVHLDKEYFSLFMHLKELVANKTNPKSDQALSLIKQLVDLSSETLSKIVSDKFKSMDLADEHNILNPFTEEEKIFLKNAFAHLSTLED